MCKKHNNKTTTITTLIETKPVKPVKNENQIESNCPVCIDVMVSPCKLPCGHIFCYECLESVMDTKPKCPLCRKVIPLD